MSSLVEVFPWKCSPYFPGVILDVLSARPYLAAGAVGTQRQEVTMANIGREIEQRAKTATVCRVREVKCNVDK